MAGLPRSLLYGLAAGAALAAGNVVSSRIAEARHPPRGRFVEIDGTELHVVEVGRGDPVVLLHGNGSMLPDFLASGLVDKLAARHRVILFDRPGYGHSTRPRWGAWTPEGQARIFAEAFGVLGLEQPIVLGHSWGALVAASLALDHPSRVGALVLATGYFYPSARLDAVAFSAPAVPLIGDALRFTISPLVGRLAWPHLLAKIFAPLPVPDSFRAAVPAAMALRPGALRAAAEEASTMIPAAAALQHRCPDITQPVVIIAGTEDAMVDTDDQSVRLYKAIPGARLHLVPGAGHMVHYADPTRVADAVAEAASLMRSITPRSTRLPAEAAS
ncbi:alpha/beta fold hydrolase [Chthonobacter albigriseus]|uniref:alpha/beta fold hydrolase n=1 Tax=Chthonobacter albigriseus TaxID=1683161 RepID=UPI0015EF558F|nr:alpha/beta hydrolase [Chthonobacter albigriseus]